MLREENIGKYYIQHVSGKYFYALSDLLITDARRTIIIGSKRGSIMPGGSRLKNNSITTPHKKVKKKTENTVI